MTSAPPEDGLTREKPPVNAEIPLEPADGVPMIRSRALSAIIAGLLALVAAVAAVVTDEVILVIVGAVLALVSLAIVLDWHRHVQARRAARAEMAAETAAQAANLARENDEALSRAARFEAEAIRARAELAEAMGSRRRRSTDDPDLDLSTGDQLSDEVVLETDTGLFSEVFFMASLVKRVSAARRGLRPLSVAVADVVVNVGTPQLAPAPPGPVAEHMLAIFREADTLARSSDGLYLILLEDTPENGAIWTLERLRRRIAEDQPDHTLWVGLSCYPAFGFDADQLVAQARGALDAAREWQQDRIEVTTASPD